MNRHKGLGWAQVQATLEANAEELWSLSEMERTGGEPDVVGHDKKTGEYIFYDCSAESPIKLSSLVSDLFGLSARRMLKALANGETNPASLAAYEERGPAVTKQSKQRRTARMIRQLRSLGYRIEPPNPQPSQAQAQ